MPHAGESRLRVALDSLLAAHLDPLLASDDGRGA